LLAVAFLLFAQLLLLERREVKSTVVSSMTGKAAAGDGSKREANLIDSWLT
jgi:hypothetical protein